MDQGKKTAQGLVEDIYATALDDQPWESVLDAIRLHTNTRMVCLLTLDGAGAQKAGSMAADDLNWADELRSSYNAGFYKYDPSLDVAKDWEAGRWYDDRHWYSPSRRSKSFYHQEFLLPRGVGYWEGVFVHRSAQASYSLSLQGGLDWADSPSARADLIDVLPHFGNAVKMQARLADLQFRAALGDAAFDSMAAPAFLLDEDRSLLKMNAAAHVLVANEPALRFVHGRFESPNMDRESWKKRCDEGVFVISRGTLKRSPLVLTLTPVSAQTLVAKDWQRPLTLMMAPSPRSRSERQQLLCAIYGLTLAEAEICIMICVDGLSPKACSDSRAVAIGTVRSQIKSIHVKTDVARLPELVRLVASL